MQRQRETGGGSSRIHRRFQTSLRPVSSLLTREMNVICTSWVPATAQPADGGAAGKPKLSDVERAPCEACKAGAGLQETRSRNKRRVVVPSAATLTCRDACKGEKGKKRSFVRRLWTSEREDELVQPPALVLIAP
jgi:hypothetical protein